MMIEQMNAIGICFMFLGLIATLFYATYLVKKTIHKKK